MRLSDFDYELPPHLIAQYPLEQRDASRMLVLDRRNQRWQDTLFLNFAEFLESNDLIVLNDTRVFPARFVACREGSGGRVEILLVREIEPFVWHALVRPGNRLKEGARLKFSKQNLQAVILDAPGATLRQVRFISDVPWDQILAEAGETPLPPYINRPSGASPADRERYQTVFASSDGAIAAPTAGLHFTEKTLQAIRAMGVNIVKITLHVGYGTFEPIRVVDIEEHKVASELFQITEEAAQKINDARAAGGRIIAVGTTTTRALETASDSAGIITPTKDSTDLTIVPGYRFRATDALVTNFHLPRSSLLLLAAAFAGGDLIVRAYQHAVQEGYRFYSYGDCTFMI